MLFAILIPALVLASTATAWAWRRHRFPPAALRVELWWPRFERELHAYGQAQRDRRSSSPQRSSRRSA